MKRASSSAARALAALGGLGSVVGAQTTEIISISSSGEVSNGGNFDPVISADGRWVAFHSNAMNLVALPDFLFTGDVFVRDRERGITTRISVPAIGGQSFEARLSADGRFVAFNSSNSVQVPNDTNGKRDVFVHDQLLQQTTLVSLATNGAQGDGDSEMCDISGDGQLVVFSSAATNFAANDANARYDVFVRLLPSGPTTCISTDAFGVPANDDSFEPALSSDGLWVAFESDATNLVPGDTNGVADIFVRDLAAGVTERASVSSAGVEGALASQRCSISADGRLVGFRSASTNLVPGDTNGVIDLFVRELATGVTQRINVSSTGAQATDGSAYAPSFSADGRFISFDSAATNLVPIDLNGGGNSGRDVFVRDMLAGTTELASVNSLGQQGNSFSNGTTQISAGGNAIVFLSFATNLVAGDTNGFTDVFVRELCPDVATFHLDADGDGYGDPHTATSSCAQPQGYVVDATDCDDGNANVHPGSAELCNALDDDCDGEVDEGFTSVSYCTPSTTVQLCSPSLSSAGMASATNANGFTLTVTDVDGDRNGTIFFGLASAAFPWAPGSTSTLCVQPPVARTDLLYSGGDHEMCNGTFALDWNAWRATHAPGVYTPGQVLYAQCWFRNSPAPGGSNLSDALRFTVCE